VQPDLRLKPVDANSDSDAISVELSSRRTGMSFQRTRMSADRTLMSVIRTALSLIGFGFTIFQVFKKLNEAGVVKSSGTARHFGATLVYLGLGMLVVGIAYHVLFMLGLRRERGTLTRLGLIHAESQFPPSFTLMIALLLFAVGVSAIVAMFTGAGPLG
jgi:putative membrane protein